VKTIAQGSDEVATLEEGLTLKGLARLYTAFPGSELVEGFDSSLGAAALDYAAHGWEVFPLRPGSKIPYTGSRGVLDASSDLEQVARWWSNAPSSNVAGRLPAGLVALDIDPRSGGLSTFERLTAELGAGCFSTLTNLSGRGDGGRHLLFLHPGGSLSTAGLHRWAEARGVGKQGASGWLSGIDLKTRGGYLVLPPSTHPDTGQQYRWEDPEAEIGAGSQELWAILLRDEQPAPAPRPVRRLDSFLGGYPGASVADSFAARTSWAEILEAHGWRLVNGDGESDGSSWKHSAAQHSASGSVRRGCFFCYSQSFAPFADFVTEAGAPRGLTKFRAFALLNFAGDLSAAARQLIAEGKEARS
jgi:hypothetical protein